MLHIKWFICNSEFQYFHHQLLSSVRDGFETGPRRVRTGLRQVRAIFEMSSGRVTRFGTSSGVRSGCVRDAFRHAGPPERKNQFFAADARQPARGLLILIFLILYKLKESCSSCSRSHQLKSDQATCKKFIKRPPKLTFIMSICTRSVASSSAIASAAKTPTVW